MFDNCVSIFLFLFYCLPWKKRYYNGFIAKTSTKKPQKYKQKQTNKEETKNAAPFEKADGKIVEKEAR